MNQVSDFAIKTVVGPERTCAFSEEVGSCILGRAAGNESPLSGRGQGARSSLLQARGSI